ncbi:MAG: helix-turn-helix transcriptional regulator [Gammaproteobacteria bacterium]|uniref:helix-turn-helix domain-containing protein n=1 Tax=Thalassobaculum sp. TaxID=2022740 RepID=UPI0032EEE6A2
MAKFYECYDDPAEIVLVRRGELSLSQRELAARIGFRSANFITMIEKGNSPMPLKRSVEIAKALEMRDPAWFVMKVLKRQHPSVYEELASDQWKRRANR